MLHIACRIIRDYQKKTFWTSTACLVRDKLRRVNICSRRRRAVLITKVFKHFVVLDSWKPLKAVVCRVLVKLLGFYTVSPLFAEALSTFYTGRSNFSCHFLAFSQIRNSCFTRSKGPSSTHTCWLPGTETNTDITGLSCICINHGRHWQHWSQRWQH